MTAAPNATEHEQLLTWKRRALQAEDWLRTLRREIVWDGQTPEAETILRSIGLAQETRPAVEPNDDQVMCPACTHRFIAIPANMQAELDAAQRQDATAGTLIDAWCRAFGKQIPWKKAVGIMAIIQKIPDEERDRLLAMGDEP
jgi:hypothetical protein